MASVASMFIAYYFLISPLFAVITAEPAAEATTLPAHAIFVPSHSSRGTLDIIWSSIFTIIACTWTIQHLNIPEQRNACAPGRGGSLKWYARKFCTSAKWMVITTIAPEIVIGMSCYDLLSAKKILRDFRKFALEDDVLWTLTHSYYANMGGFVIQSRIQEPLQPTPYISLGELSFAAHSGTASRIEPQHRSQRNRPATPPIRTRERDQISYYDPYHLTGRQILQLRKDRILPRLPDISETELADRSKSDAFVKAIAIFQILWATIQIIVRTAKKLVISQLELAVIAFATCAIIMYVLYWSKPKNVGSTTTILQFEGAIPQNVLTLINCPQTYMGYFLIGDDTGKSRHGSPIRNDATENYYDADAGFWVIQAMILGATVFGGIHVGAWNFHFPTSVELVLWRVASVYSAACGPIILLMGVLLALSEDLEKHRLLIVQILVFMYITARLVLLVETFRTLFFLPPLAFVSTWTANIPHFG
jgi:hypothetical protein